MAFRRFLKPGLVLSAALLTASGARADMRAQDEVHRAVKRGEIQSLTDILTVVRSQLPGDIVGTEIEMKRGRWIYEFRTVDGKGRIFEVTVDARTGKIEQIEEK